MGWFGDHFRHQWLESRIITLKQWFSNLRMHQNHLVGFLKTKLLDPSLRVLDSVGLRLGLRIYTFNKFSVDGDVLGLGTTLSQPLGCMHFF